MSRLLFEMRAGSDAGARAGEVTYRAWVNCDDSGVPFMCSYDGGCARTVLYDCFYCDEHLESVCGVRIGPSPIAGMGLFATRQFRRNDVITHYGGEIITPAEMETRYGCITTNDGEQLVMTAPYALGIDQSDETRDAVRVRGAGSYCNSPEGSSVRRRANARLGNRHIRASTTIQPGTEILCAYGRDYWQSAGPRTITHETRLVDDASLLPPFKRRRDGGE